MPGYIAAKILSSIRLRLTLFFANISSRDVLAFLVGTLAGAIIYRFQYRQLCGLIFPLEGVDSIDMSLNAPLAGAILGAVTTCVIVMSNKQELKCAAILSVAGGAFVGTFFIDLMIYGAWQNEVEGSFSVRETFLRATPMAAFATLWSLLLILYGVILYVKSKQNLESL